jgi:mevalonate pyrophosphate decarboxylase
VETASRPLNSPPTAWEEHETFESVDRDIATDISLCARRADGLAVAFTIDAGPNVHCICPAEFSTQVENLVRAIPGVERILTSGVGGGSRLVA